ncbi:aldehyde dehydrogenase family protein [Melghirimyces profundicolus]|uniref:Aldehyde dehydrogenase family protein n=1 Tax=Melghirimyces profundicolus TaxID=1242148 RepID=A0A2T6C4T2_9BACL|nr:aldehyde dehydrogenase family protein [Melghirimyces profundicolus]PTX63324.1 aldehyde dehydrogenase family protein [Melghirimyces profundicolus]
MQKEQVKISLLKEEPPLLINGEPVPSPSGEWFETFKPATEETIARVAKATRENVDKAVEAARFALEESKWAKWRASRRGQILYRVAAITKPLNPVGV